MTRTTAASSQRTVDRWRRLALVATLLVMSVGCSEKKTSTEDANPVDPSLTRTTEVGPVKATVALTPGAPRLGDNLSLALKVEVAAGVVVEMPGFGEALGRFSIVDYKPSERTNPDGSRVLSQTYTLQAPMSGRQRIPPLRLEFIDERPATAATDSAGARELLTEELTIEIESVLPDGEITAELKPMRARLNERPASLVARFGPLALGVMGVVVVVLAIRAWLLYRRARIRASAYDVAIGRIAKLERRGLPDPNDADAWYVELSGIIRRYLEDRFGVRAPELTTEEFLREARRSVELTPGHRDLLSAFLERCDRVKFAAYHPEASESSEALATARSFLLETRLRSEASKAASKAA